MIDDIKNNKYMKFNLSEKFNFFKTFVNAKKMEYEDFDVSSKKVADKVEISWQALKGLDKNKIEDDSAINVLDKGEEADNEINVNDNAIFIDNKILEKKMKKFKITTELKKMIFIAIASSSDCNDAFEKLMRLNLKNDQSREIIKIIILLTTEEKSYNPFYKLLLSKIISVDKNHKYTFHYTIWDHMKIMESDNYNLKKIHNLAKLVSDLLSEQKISLPVILNFAFEEANIKQRTFINFLMDKLFGNLNNTPDKIKILFAKLVKNDDHVEFGKRLFYYLINDFKKEIELNKKEEMYMKCYISATKILKKIL